VGVYGHKKVYDLIIQNVGGILSLPIIESLQSSQIPSGVIRFINTAYSTNHNNLFRYSLQPGFD